MLTKMLNPLQKCLLKFDSEKEGTFQGYASVFNSDDAVNDTILPGAFTKSLKVAMPAMFINHNHDDVAVGDWTVLKEDDRGLYGEGVIDMVHHMGPTAHSAMVRKALTGLSIGFTMAADGFTRKSDGGRIIKEVNLKEVSLVTFPCEDQARIVGVKQEAIGDLLTLGDCENYLREVCGFSKSAAVAFVSRIKKFARSDSDVNFEREITEHNEKVSAEVAQTITGIRRFFEE